MTTPAGLRQAARRDDGELWCWLLTLTHPALPSGPLRLAAGPTSAVVSRGQTFEPYAFAVDAAPADGPAEATVKLDNLDRRLVEAIKGSRTRASVLLELIRASAPDIVEKALPLMDLVEGDWDLPSIELSLSTPDDSEEPAVRHSYTPSFAPGLHG